MEMSIEDQVEQDVINLCVQLDNGSNIRNKIITKLSTVFDDMEFVSTDSASVTEAKMSIVNTLLKTVNDEENQRIGVIKVKQNIKRDSDVNAALSSVGNVVAEYMKNLNSAVKMDTTGNPSDQISELNNRVAAENIEILPGELEMKPITTETD